MTDTHDLPPSARGVRRQPIIRRHQLRRETHRCANDRHETDHFRIRGEDAPASAERDVTLEIVETIPPRGFAREEYPPCPDCGGEIVWAEAGGVPGSRKCMGCGSAFADARYSAAYLDVAV